MRGDARTTLADVLHAAAAIQDFTRGLDAQAFELNAQVQSAVMYQLMVIGEALNVLAHENPATAERIPQLADAVGMRNRLIHGYQIVDSEIVWATIQEDVPGLVVAVRAALDE